MEPPPADEPEGGVLRQPRPTAGYCGGPWKRTLATADFAGFRKYVVDFCTDSRPVKNYAPNDGDQRGYGWGYLAHEAKDDKIPATPTVERRRRRATGSRRRRSPRPPGTSRRRWNGGSAGSASAAGTNSTTTGGRRSATGRAIDIPAEVFKEPGEYRVRARWRDDTGRCGHWSAPVTVSVR